MYCRKCGGESFDGQGGCLRCGWSISARIGAGSAGLAEEQPPDSDPEALYHQSEEQVTPGIARGRDGVLRWVYEMSLWRNPTVLISTGKVLLISCGIVAIFIFFISLGDGFAEALYRAGWVLGIMLGIMGGLLVLSYAVYALFSGGSYIVLFEMDEEGVTHRQLQKQFRNARSLAKVGLLLGAVAGNVTTTALSYNAATRSSMHSAFTNVKKARIAPGRHVIHLTETLNRNQIYAGPEDFAFVRDFILARLPDQAQVIEKREGL